MIKLFGKFSLFFLCIAFFSVNISGQTHSTAELCDSNKALLEAVHRLYIESVGDKTKSPRYTFEMPVIIIARLGKNEKLSKYNIQRLKEIETYFFKWGGMPEELIITAQGEKTKDKGKIEVYYGGVLQFDITFKRNQYLNLMKGGFCDY